MPVAAIRVCKRGSAAGQPVDFAVFVEGLGVAIREDSRVGVDGVSEEDEEIWILIGGRAQYMEVQIQRADVAEVRVAADHEPDVGGLVLRRGGAERTRGTHFLGEDPAADALEAVVVLGARGEAPDLARAVKSFSAEASASFSRAMLVKPASVATSTRSNTASASPHAARSAQFR